MFVRKFSRTALRSGVAAVGVSVLLSPDVSVAQSQGAPPPQTQVADNVAATNRVETVIVTARRKSENEQNVPISETVLSPDVLSNNHITSAVKIDELVPSLQAISFNARNTNFSIRGLGSNIGLANDGIEGGVGVYVDGVFLPRPAEATFDTPDISAIEVLRGPQGTLYGKNTTSGAINISTERPTQDFEANAFASAGDYAYQNYGGTVSGPLDASGTLLDRLTAYDTDRSGFLNDITTHQHTDDYHDYGFRNQVLFEPTGDFTLRVIADYTKQHELCCMTVLENVITTLADGQALPRNFYQRAAQAGYTPLPIDPFARVTDANSSYHEIMDQGGISAQADWQLGGFDLTSITSFRFWNWNPDNDSDITSLSVLTVARQADEDHDVTQEFRISSPTGGDFEYSAGLFYFWEEDNGFGQQFFGKDAPLWVLGTNSQDAQWALDGAGIVSWSKPIINSYAAYGQATWHITPKFDLIGGVRYTYEQKTGDFRQIQFGGVDPNTLPPADKATVLAYRKAVGLVPDLPPNVKANDGMPSGLATAVYHVSDDFSTYATYSHGAKSAGLNLSALPPGVPQVVQPEYEDNYEAGFKSFFFDHRLLLNADAFWDVDSNYQATIFTCAATCVNYISNIPSVRSRGLEWDLRAEPIDGLSAYLSGAYTAALYEEYPKAPCALPNYQVIGGKLTAEVCNLSGRALPAVSKWGFSGGAQYDHGLGNWGFGGIDGYVGADVNNHSGYFSAASDDPNSRVGGATITNLRVGVHTDDGRWGLELWTLNAFDVHYYQTIGAVAFNSGAYSALLGDPRTFGLTFKFKY
jgi:iron complex outermembrane receptor protein